MEFFTSVKGLAFFAEILLKSCLILAFALFLSRLFHRQPASFRHALLWISLLSLVLLPFLAAFAPGWNTHLLPFSPGQGEEHGKKETGIITITADTDALLATNPGDRGIRTAVTYRSGQPEAPGQILSHRLYPLGLLAIWSSGMLLLLITLTFGLYAARQLTRKGVTVRGYPWNKLRKLFFRNTPIRKSIRLIRNDRVMVPMTWGFRQPVILLPGASSGWSIDQCSAALFHELAHIERGDFLIRLLARLSCSLYWFNPLAWIVFQRLKKEQEKACDELVLRAGVKPSTYAACLLQLRKSIPDGKRFPVAALGMAGQSEFKERLHSILKKQTHIKEVTMKTKLTFFVLVIFAIVLVGTARPYQAQTPDDTAKVVAGQETEKKQAQKAEVKEEKKKEIKIIVTDEKDKDGKCNNDEEKKIVLCSDSGKVYLVKKEGNRLTILENDKPIKTLELTGGKNVFRFKTNADDVFDIISDEYDAKDEKDGKKNIRIKVKSDKGDKDHQRIVVKKIARPGLEDKVQALKKAMESIAKELPKKTPAQEKALQEMEKTLQEMEMTLQEKDAELTWTEKDLKTKEKMLFIHEKGMEKAHIEMIEAQKEIEKAHAELLEAEQELKAKKEMKFADEKEMKAAQAEIAKAEKEIEKVHAELKAKHLELAEIEHLAPGGKEFVWVSEDEVKGAGYVMQLVSKQEIGPDQLDKLQKAVMKLRDSLPKTYKVNTDITPDSQSVTITHPKLDLEEKIQEKAQAEITAFEETFKSILPGQEGQKKIIKKITIDKEENK